MGAAVGRVLYAKRAPEARYELWKKLGVIPKGIDTDIVNIMNRTHMGCDKGYKNITKQCSRAALADGWAGSMMGIDLQGVIFGTPYPI